MTILLAIIIAVGYILLSLLLILILAMCIPFHYNFIGEKYDLTKIKAEINWLFSGLKMIYQKDHDIKGFFSIIILGFHLKIKPNRKSETKVKKNNKKDEKKNKPKHSRSRINPQIFLNKIFVRRTQKFIKDIFRHISPRQFNLEGTFGFDDPAYTGMACAFINPVSVILKDYNINMSPVFDDEIIEGKFSVKGSITPMLLVWITAMFLLSRPVRNIYKSLKNKK